MTCQLCYGKGFITGSEGEVGWTIGCECITGEVDLFTFAKQIGFKETGDELVYTTDKGDLFLTSAGRVYTDLIKDATEEGLLTLINSMR